MNQNHANFQGRLDFIRNLLRERFGGDEARINPIQYDPESPFKYNNFVYRITLPSPPSAARNHSSHETRQPGTAPLSEGAKEFIMRLTNPDAEGMHAHTRVENEVALISLAAAALSGFKPHVVPSVYGWGSAAPPSSQGWILQELMPGASVSEAFNSMPLGEKKSILAQMAEILKALQNFQLPSSIEQYGGVTFDGAGQIVSTAMTSYYFRDRLERALQQADSNPYIKGWHANGVRKRLEAFVESGVPAQFKALESRDDKALVHADFTPDNLLYDASTQRITALIDYDFACILHPSYEFLRSFSGAGGQFQGWSDIESSEQTALRDAKLHGFPSTLPENTEDGVKWDVAKVWEDELERLDVQRPRTIKGIEKVADVDAVIRSILPWRVTNSDVLRVQSESVILKCRDENEAQLVKLLDHLKF
ncbi:kinase-like domain-containing protein [Lophiotrema nucula]|uniref:Kinase-like domain-containing protein n=1 Tax=Lophiotrema nucula TaxID=690887 RepID=A0A6A5ZCV3_9PLEO|nr:kinase-like domain-containing protein [Lophiotrema nucula]